MSWFLMKGIVARISCIFAAGGGGGLMANDGILESPFGADSLVLHTPFLSSAKVLALAGLEL